MSIWKETKCWLLTSMIWKLWRYRAMVSTCRMLRYLMATLFNSSLFLIKAQIRIRLWSEETLIWAFKTNWCWSTKEMARIIKSIRSRFLWLNKMISKSRLVSPLNSRCSNYSSKLTSSSKSRFCNSKWCSSISRAWTNNHRSQGQPMARILKWWFCSKSSKTNQIWARRRSTSCWRIWLRFLATWISSHPFNDKLLI